MTDTSTHNDKYPATWVPGGPQYPPPDGTTKQNPQLQYVPYVIERVTNKCKAKIEFAVDYEGKVFECDLNEGHIGPHRQKGINDYNGGKGESYTIYWESKVDASVYKMAEELETPIQEELFALAFHEDLR